MAKWLFLYLSERLIASSIFWFLRDMATFGANSRDWLLAALKVRYRSTMIAMDQIDMTTRMINTMRATQPILRHTPIGEKSNAAASPP